MSLIERLRAEAELEEDSSVMQDYFHAGILKEAADALEAKDARIEALERDNARLREDKARLDWLQSEYNDVRWISGHGTEMCSPSDEVAIRIVSHHMTEPCERVEAENWNEDLRRAIDDARQVLQDTGEAS